MTSPLAKSHKNRVIGLETEKTVTPIVTRRISSDFKDLKISGVKKKLRRVWILNEWVNRLKVKIYSLTLTVWKWPYGQNLYIEGRWQTRLWESEVSSTAVADSGGLSFLGSHQ